MRSFEESGDWEKLEVGIGMMWILELPEDGIRAEEVEWATRRRNLVLVDIVKMVLLS